MNLHQAVHHLHLEEEEVPDNVVGLIPVTKNHLSTRKWAADNAHTLLFILFLFVITWILFLLTDFGVI